MKAYRLLTEDDTSEFCHKVTEALSKGWELYGDPVISHDATTGKMRCAQAVIKHSDQTYTSETKLGAL
ncbi:DUF1737 domain-containing protein [Candidatus Halocynthiibacter alkanivorans]|jgi:hypothetical protein|uniref:DUF1737 domain-containing protein n=1 Tax=Candidatus Halocynthiibacter alkanivorans TaxID=2267619 RepID=UPI000DF43588|nr:DUF1737 domain-containing protein [Candidatus Halocynthiibacter alkanivorans]